LSFGVGFWYLYVLVALRWLQRCICCISVFVVILVVLCKVLRCWFTFIIVRARGCRLRHWWYHSPNSMLWESILYYRLPGFVTFTITWLPLNLLEDFSLS
jgi:hypothetical protein